MLELPFAGTKCNHGGALTVTLLGTSLVPMPTPKGSSTMLLTMTMMLCCLGMASAAVCNGGTDPSPKTDTGCRYGACAQPSATSGRCVHDGGECANGEVYVKAVNTERELNGLVCTCEDILSYPSTIGICDHDGAMTPMAIASDCPTGSTPICDADANGRCASKDALCSLFPRPTTPPPCA